MNDPLLNLPPQDKPTLPPLDLGLAVGSDFYFQQTKIRLERVEADGSVDLRSLRTNSLLSVRNPDGTTSRTTLEWMRARYADHSLAAIGPVPEGASQRQARFLLLDTTAADAKDAKARWRNSLAWRALAAEIANTDKACEEWLDSAYGLVPLDLTFKRPSGSSLKRWMRRLRKGSLKIGALVSQAGRPRNHSQLEAEVDAAVTTAALYFYSAPGINKVMADSYLDDLITALNSSLPPGRILPFKKPSRQTVSARIDKLECFETIEKKFGREAAERKYRGSGEPLLVDHVLEVGLMDATQLEQVVVFDEAWNIPALKMRIVVLMDVLSHCIFGWNVYPGPNRAEATAQAFLHCLEADKFPKRMVDLHPKLRLAFGRFASVLPDNEKALIGPETVHGYNEAGCTVIPAPVGMPTAKASLERFWRTLKQVLAQLPGTLVDPKRAMEMGYEHAMESAELTMHQFRDIVAQVIAQHNVSESKGLDGLAPVDVLHNRSATRATPAFEDPGPVRAALCRTFRVFVTRNGVEKDTIRYRTAASIDQLFDNNAGRQGGAGDSNGFDARARRNDGNIDQLEVYDEHAGEWLPLASTQPGYTANLSFWEHEQYKAAAKLRREPFGSQSAKLSSMSETRRVMEKMLPRAKFQGRSKMAALALSRQVESLNGKPITLPEGVQVAAQAVADFRKDDPTLAPTPAAKVGKPAQASTPDQRVPQYADTKTDWDDDNFGEDE